jgi:diguanylate cyclase (GGDEF)-like protein/PAS domain S-box-containing protein
MGKKADGALAPSGVDAFLREHPGAVVAAVGNDGLFVPLPDGVDLSDRHRRTGLRAATDLVERADRAAVIAAWERARVDGDTVVEARLRDHDGPAEMHFVDARDELGVFLMVFDVGVDIGDGDGRIDVPLDPPAPEGSRAKVVRSRKDGLAVLVEIDPNVSELLGWRVEDMVGVRSLEFIHPDDQDESIAAWFDMLAAPGLTTRARLRHACADGSWMWLDISNRNLLDEEGYVDCEMVDVSEEVAAQGALAASEQVLRRLTESMPVGVFHIGADRRLELANARLHEILGTEPGDDQATMLSTLRDEIAFDRALAAVLSGTDVDIEMEIQVFGTLDVRRCTLALRALSIDDAITGAVGCLTDVTESVRLREELERRATIDELTGCLNRASVIETLEDCLATGADVAVVYVDVDDFKGVNDGHGHAAGDEVLQAVGARLRAAVRGHDAVGRMGGDEFLAVCAGLGSEVGAGELAQRIAASLGDPVGFRGQRLEITASVGVAWSPAGEHIEADALVARADSAMYVTKGAGGGGHTVH